MSRMRSMMAALLLGGGALLLAAQFAPAGILTSHVMIASCHEESGPPLGKTPQTHDCCAVGHHRAMVTSDCTVPHLGLAPLGTFRNAGAGGHDGQWSASPSAIDTGPRPTAVPMRI